jgi:SpoVK/Ycf46/Vps4 family AAA+-type ATPase
MPALAMKASTARAPFVALLPEGDGDGGGAGAGIVLSNGGGLVLHRAGHGASQGVGQGAAMMRYLASSEGWSQVAVFREALWFTTPGPNPQLHRYDLTGPEPAGEVGAPLALSFTTQPALLKAPFGAPCVLWLGTPALEVHDDLGSLVKTELIAPLGAIPIARKRRVVLEETGLLAVDQPGGRTRVRPPVKLAAPLDGCALWEGRALVVRDRRESALFVLTLPDGALQHRIAIPPDATVHYAPVRGYALVQAGDGTLSVLDLRFGRSLRVWKEEAPPLATTIDPEGHRVAILRGAGTIDDVTTVDLRQQGAENVAAAERPARKRAPRLRRALAEVPKSGAAPAESGTASPTPPASQMPSSLLSFGDSPAPSTPPAPSVTASVPHLSTLPLAALRPLPPITADKAAVASDLQRRLDLIGARCERAIAADWDSGRLSLQEAGLPFENEVLAIVRRSSGRAGAPLAQAHARLDQRRTELADGTLAGTPLAHLAEELGLSALAIDILLVAVAPALWGELARLYAIVANDPARPICDELLLGQILGPEVSRREIAQELLLEAPLVAHGLIQRGAGSPPFAEVRAHPLVVRRLCGEPIALSEDEASAAPALEDLVVPRAPLVQLLAFLASEADPTHVRVVVRGRPQSGRRTVLGALAARAHRGLGLVDVGRVLQRANDNPAERLRRELEGVVIAGGLPCVTGIDGLASADPAMREVVQSVLRQHPGPLALRCAPGTQPPLDAGWFLLDLPPLQESERRELLARTLSHASLPQDGVDDLAARYRIAPGTIQSVVGRLASPPDARTIDPPELARRFDDEIRQHRAARLGDVASHVTRLATWSQVVLPDDTLDSVRELIGRVRHRRTVYEKWGFDRLITSARGLTALFLGGPGTGKTLVAGVVARELGLDLYRVDLSRILSKWIGETEQNLARVFDAAEDGHAILLFDEADSLFSRRTEVRSSVDRYANIEVNYLLQRLDSFDGIAILTSNLSTSIDPAFKRRLSMQLAFPFPDAEMREKLWRVHLPAGLPTRGELDLASLSERYQLSGGYIRNSALRAAFLAAQEETALTQDHLERAIKLEYRQLGKLVESGTLE